MKYLDRKARKRIALILSLRNGVCMSYIISCISRSPISADRPSIHKADNVVIICFEGEYSKDKDGVMLVSNALEI